MENEETITPVPSKIHPSASIDSRRPWFRVAGWSLICLLVVAEGLQIWQIFTLRSQVHGLEWSEAIHARDDDSAITPDVGVIQFMKKGGYSITIDSAKYGGDGLYLHGVIGNPTRLSISNLALKFTATKELYQYKDEFDKGNDYILLFGPPPIGEGQTTPIVELVQGQTMPFEVTIPNVKQSKDGFRLVVAFTGERYSYGY